MNRTIAILAALAAFAAACATEPAQTTENGPSAIAAIPGTPEFHGAALGNDGLRSRLDSE
ncbi:MAG: hypothetical protein WDM79_04355 [Terricaulis sp.]